MGVEFAEHGAHGLCGGKPLVDSQETVDAKTYKKDNEGTVDMGGESACMDGRHWVEV